MSVSFCLVDRQVSVRMWQRIKARRENYCAARGWLNQRPLYRGMRKDDARSSCRTLHVRIRRRNCVRVGPVRCYFTGSNCRHKHGKHSQAGRTLGFGLNRYGTHSPRTSRYLSPILFYPRTPVRMSNRPLHLRSHSFLRHQPISREISRPKAAPGVSSKWTFDPFRTVPSERIRFYGSLVGTRLSIIAVNLEIERGWFSKPLVLNWSPFSTLCP